jgi:hypothetical protein
VQEICPEKDTVFDNTVNLSRATVTQRIEDISSDLNNQLRNKGKEFESFCLALDESNDTSDTAQSLTVVPGITEYFEVVKELASLKSWHDTTKGESLFLSA